MSDLKVRLPAEITMRTRESYNYFSKPDGEEIVEKWWHLIKPATAAGLAFSTIDVMLNSKPKGYGSILARYAYITAPFIGCTTAFVLVSNLSAGLRKEQDRVNWAIGGAAAGAILGVWTRKQPVGWNAAVGLGLLAYLKKYQVESGFELMPQNKSHVLIRSGGYDYTLTKEIKGNYTKDILPK